MSTSRLPKGWDGIVALTFLVFGSSAFAVPAQQAGFGPLAIWGVRAAVVGAIAWLVFVYKVNAVPLPRVIGGLWVAMILMVVTVRSQQVPAEQFHVFTFAPLGFALTRAASRTRGLALGVPMAFALVAWVGVADEFLQGFLDDRYYDPRDVRLDLLGASVGVALALPVAGRGAVAPEGEPRRVLHAVAVLAVVCLVAMQLASWSTFDPEDVVGTWDGENPCGPEQLALARGGALEWKDLEGNHATGRWSVTSNAFGETVLRLEVTDSSNAHDPETEPLCGLRTDGRMRGSYASPIVVEDGALHLGGTKRRTWTRSGRG